MLLGGVSRGLDVFICSLSEFVCIRLCLVQDFLIRVHCWLGFFLYTLILSLFSLGLCDLRLVAYLLYVRGPFTDFVVYGFVAQVVLDCVLLCSFSSHLFMVFFVVSSAVFVCVLLTLMFWFVYSLVSWCAFFLFCIWDVGVPSRFSWFWIDFFFILLPFIFRAYKGVCGAR